jgi:hypothetical protein
MQVKERKISELKSAEYNPRLMTEDDYRDLKASLQAFGCVDPIVVNQHKGRKDVVVGGHQRLKIWTDLGHKTIPCVYVDLPLARERELNVRLNKNVCHWDWDVLANNFDMGELEQWGFSEDMLLGNNIPPATKAVRNNGKEKGGGEQVKCPQCGYIIERGE